MQPRRMLIVYGTSYGQTEKIALRMATLLSAAGDTVTCTRADALPRGLAPRDFDGVIVGASVIRGRHQRSVRRFVRAHHDALNGKPSAFFSVSGSAAAADEPTRDAARRCMDEFLCESGWHPRLAASIAGAMSFTKYDPITRWILKRISRREGGPTDTSRDHELTDWTQVERFLRAFAATVPYRNGDRAFVSAPSRSATSAPPAA
jgi:menaquinone-dependent protoporphyrinogen oxidase